MILPLLIAAWITISPLPQQGENVSVMLAEFRIDANDNQILNLNNYQLEDQSGNIVATLQIDRLSEIDGIVIDKTKVVAITTNRLQSKKAYTLKFINERAWFYYNGFVPNSMSVQNVGMKK